MEIAAKTDLLDLDFIGTKDFSRSAQRVVLGMVEAAYEVCIESDFRGEELRIPDRILVPRVAVQPRPVCVSKGSCRLRLFGLGGRVGRWLRRHCSWLGGCHRPNRWGCGRRRRCGRTYRWL